MTSIAVDELIVTCFVKGDIVKLYCPQSKKSSFLKIFTKTGILAGVREAQEKGGQEVHASLFSLKGKSVSVSSENLFRSRIYAAVEVRRVELLPIPPTIIIKSKNGWVCLYVGNDPVMYYGGMWAVYEGFQKWIEERLSSLDETGGPHVIAPLFTPVSDIPVISEMFSYGALFPDYASFVDAVPPMKALASKKMEINPYAKAYELIAPKIDSFRAEGKRLIDKDDLTLWFKPYGITVDKAMLDFLKLMFGWERRYYCKRKVPYSSWDWEPNKRQVKICRPGIPLDAWMSGNKGKPNILPICMFIEYVLAQDYAARKKAQSRLIRKPCRDKLFDILLRIHKEQYVVIIETLAAVAYSRGRRRIETRTPWQETDDIVHLANARLKEMVA